MTLDDEDDIQSESWLTLNNDIDKSQYQKPVVKLLNMLLHCTTSKLSA